MAIIDSTNRPYLKTKVVTVGVNLTQREETGKRKTGKRKSSLGFTVTSFIDKNWQEERNIYFFLSFSSKEYDRV